MAATLLIWTMDAGFFANFVWVLNNLHSGMAAMGASAARVEWIREPHYSDFSYGAVGENAWDLYFEPLDFPDAPAETVRAHHLYMTRPLSGQWTYERYRFDRTWRQSFNDIYRRYIRVRPRILEKVERLRSELFAGHRVVGVHARNPGHSVENMFPIPPAPYWIARTRALLDDYPGARVFLASDYAPTVSAFREAFGDRLIVQADVDRAEGTARQVHQHHAAPGVALGEQVLVDCLLLASCDAMLHVTSNVATSAGLINPTMRMVYCESPLRAAVAGAYVRVFGRRGITIWTRPGRLLEKIGLRRQR